MRLESTSRKITYLCILFYHYFLLQIINNGTVKEVRFLNIVATNFGDSLYAFRENYLRS